ncbi:BSD domain-containing protein 1 [Podochytrium sp. JEL0797]|nr:BSD domain-containing protein 1 [Podochytrium sp. JEL0797]
MDAATPDKQATDTPAPAASEQATTGSSGWGWGAIPSWDSLVDTVKKQTDVVAAVLERDLGEFVSVVAPGPTEDTPSSIADEAPLSAAPAAAAAIANIDALVDRAEGLLHNAEHLADKAEDFLESVENNVWSFVSSAIMGVKQKPSTPKQNIIFDRKTATILAMRHNESTYTLDPSILPASPSTAESDLAQRFRNFADKFEISIYSTQIARLLDEDEKVRSIMAKCVPSSTTYDEFWTRYFFRVQEVDREEEARRNLLSDASLNEDEINWDDDSDSETEQPLQKSATKPVQPSSTTDRPQPVLIGPVSITEAVASVEGSESARSVNGKVSPLSVGTGNGGLRSDRSSFDVLSEKPAVESLPESEASGVIVESSVDEAEEDVVERDAAEEEGSGEPGVEDAKKPKTKLVKKEGDDDDEEEEEGAEWDTWE